MFDINAPEFLMLAAFAVIIFGPEKLPELARKAARLLNYFRNIANDAQGKLRAELGTDLADLNISDLHPKALLASTLLDPVKAEVTAVTATVSETIAEAKTDPEPVVVAREPVLFDTEAT
ncbi:MAG: translocase [Actinobacteria bacterium HGW-Actinobacteria-2]|nr:MAG: translocase [Actinobacteria bacterium HGW-Actinobacteria-2]